jgi:hypothetical protein
MFLHSVYSVLLLLILYSVLLMYYCLCIVHCLHYVTLVTLPLGISPIAVGNVCVCVCTYIYIYIHYKQTLYVTVIARTTSRTLR